MRSLLLPTALAFAALPAAFAPRAAADPFTSHFNDLLAELNDRDAALPFPAENGAQRKQRSAIARCYRFLGKPSDSVAGDLRTAFRISKTVLRAFPGDPTFASLVAALDADLDAESVAIRDEVETTVLLLSEGKFRTKAFARLGQSDELRARADLEPDPVRRARFRDKSHRKVVVASRIADRGQPAPPADESLMTATVAGSPWAANNDYGTGVGGSVRVSDTNGGVRRIQVFGRRILPSVVPPEPPNPPLPGDESRIDFTITRVSQDLQAGTTYTVGNADGVNTTASWFAEDEDGTVHNAVPLSGSITIDTIVLEFGQATVTGSFQFTMYDGVADQTFDISGGLFEAHDVPRINVP